MPDLQQHISSLERVVGDQPRSPLFARLASLYLEAGRPKDALRVCDSGLASFPYYSTAHLVKGKALVALNMKSEARREFEIVHAWLPTNPTVADFLEELPVSDQDFLSEPSPAAEPKEEAAPIAGQPSVSSEPAPTAEEPMGGMAMFAGSGASAPAPEAAPSAAEEPTNVFGLPSEAPPQDTPVEQTTEPASTSSDFGSMEGFGVFGEPSAIAPAEEPVGETYESFAARVRAELGPSGGMSLEEFLGSGVEGDGSAPPLEPVPESPQPDAFSTDAFASFGSDGSASPATPAEPEIADPSPIEAATPAPDPDPFAAFAGPSLESTQASEPQQESAPETASPGFPDFSGLSFPAETPSAESVPTPETALPAESSDGGFSGPSFEGPPPVSENKIEEFAEKLQDAGKITPVIDFSSKTSSESTGEAAVNAGFVTPTLAEIYAKQGWFDDAINAYKTLARTRPADKEKFELRVKELEEEKGKAG